jgi:hypothetical protein
MSSRRGLVRMFVLNSMADDYENLSVSIIPALNRDGADCGMTIEKDEVVQALREAVELGWVKAYKLYASSRKPDEFGRMPTLEEMEDPMGAWFDLTEAGRKVQMAEFEGWPFDENNVLRKDWVPPVS